MESEENKRVEEAKQNQNGLKNGKKNLSEIDSFLQNIYYNTRHPASFSSAETLYNYIIENTDMKIPRKNIKIWLSKQESYTAHRPVRRTFKRPRVLAFYKNYQWDTDTANMMKYKKQNDGFGYFAVFIDIFTRFLYTQAMKTLTGREMVSVLNKIFQKSLDQPHILRSDQGSEYVNREVRTFLKERKVKHIYTFYETKANYAERVIKTIKLKIVKYLTANETFRWIDELENLTYSYNNTIHTSIGMSPSVASKDSKKYDLWKRQYGTEGKQKENFNQNKKKNPKLTETTSRRYKFRLGDRVKISYLKNQFDREYSEKWSGEIFTIINKKMNQNIPMYQIKDYNNEIIQSYFYEPELQLGFLDEDTIYKIEKIESRRKRKGVREVLVKWKGWPKIFNSWIPEANISDI